MNQQDEFKPSKSLMDLHMESVKNMSQTQNPKEWTELLEEYMDKYYHDRFGPIEEDEHIVTKIVHAAITQTLTTLKEELLKEKQSVSKGGMRGLFQAGQWDGLDFSLAKIDDILKTYQKE
jgi:hypothetical protein